MLPDRGAKHPSGRDVSLPRAAVTKSRWGAVRCRGHRRRRRSQGLIGRLPVPIRSGQHAPIAEEPTRGQSGHVYVDLSRRGCAAGHAGGSPDPNGGPSGWLAREPQRGFTPHRTQRIHSTVRIVPKKRRGKGIRHFLRNYLPQRCHPVGPVLPRRTSAAPSATAHSLPKGPAGDGPVEPGNKPYWPSITLSRSATGAEKAYWRRIEPADNPYRDFPPSRSSAGCIG